MSWAYRDEPERLGFPAVPVAIGLASVLLFAVVAYAISRSSNGAPPGVVTVHASSGTLPATARPAPTQVIANLAYGPDPVERIDLYRPPGTKARLPILVFLHSGGWLSGTRDQVPDFILQEVTRLNVEVASVGYRLSVRNGVNPFPDAVYDVDRAVRFLTVNAAFLALDPTRVILSGTSAGGHLAALDAVASGAFIEPGLPPALAAATPHVIGVIDAVGPSDLLAMGREGGLAAGMVTAFLDCPTTTATSCTPAVLQQASIASHLTASAPPAFLVYGRKDTLVPPSTQGTPLAAAWARARGDTARLPSERAVWYEIANDGHNVSQASIDMVALQRWLSDVLSGRFR